MTGPDDSDKDPPLSPNDQAFDDLHNQFAFDVEAAVRTRSERALAVAIDRFRAAEIYKDEAWAEERVRRALSSIRRQPQTPEAAWGFILGASGPQVPDSTQNAPGQPILTQLDQPAGPASNASLLFIIAAIAVLAIGAYVLFGSGGGSSPSKSSQGIAIVAGQPNLPQATRTAQNVPPASGTDQVLTLNMQFTQTFVRSEGRCPTPLPAAGADLSPKTPTKVTINKTKRTIQLENLDGSRSNVAPYDAATGLALITYPTAPDSRTSTVKVTDQTLDGESTAFPYRAVQPAQQFPDCKFVLKTTAKII